VVFEFLPALANTLLSAEQWKEKFFVFLGIFFFPFGEGSKLPLPPSVVFCRELLAFARDFAFFVGCRSDNCLL